MPQSFWGGYGSAGRRHSAYGSIRNSFRFTRHCRPEHRRRGCARQVVEVLELQALFQGFGRMVMEIGRDIPEAISLYRKMGYREIEPFTIFADNKDTLCMEKELL